MPPRKGPLKAGLYGWGLLGRGGGRAWLSHSGSAANVLDLGERVRPGIVTYLLLAPFPEFLLCVSSGLSWLQRTKTQLK